MRDMINFIRNPDNALEDGGRSGAPVQEKAEAKRICPNCHRSVPVSSLWKNAGVCPCGYHYRIPAGARIRLITDPKSFRERDADLICEKIPDFPGYENKLKAARLRSSQTEAVTCGTARIGGVDCCVFAMNPEFMMGSMGCAVGEKITGLFEYAADRRMPVVGFTVSGGARMQEGLLSLMQMAKTSGAVMRHHQAGGFYLTVLTDPTTGGVTASFAMEGDIILSEPGATVGFAGARVVEQTTKKALPKGFQTAESLLAHGFIDAIVPRMRMKSTIADLLRMHAADRKADPEGICPAQGVQRKECTLTENAQAGDPAPHVLRKEVSEDAPRTGQDGMQTATDAANGKSPQTEYDIFKIARSAKRPTGSDYIAGIFTGFFELHGDRTFGDDPAIIGGIAYLGSLPVTVIAIEKGHTAKERSERAFGMPQPEGYRKTLRLMRQAEKFHRPVICFVDTAGAYCGIGAEEHGQGEAIARNLMEMMALKVPVISILIGEGGSGGALALSVADRVWMLENAVYSVISPEGCASILWKDAKKADEAAHYLRPTAYHALEEGIVEEIISEDGLGSAAFYEALRKKLLREIRLLQDTPDLTQKRYERFRKIGIGNIVYNNERLR